MDFPQRRGLDGGEAEGRGLFCPATPAPGGRAHPPPECWEGRAPLSPLACLNRRERGEGVSHAPATPHLRRLGADRAVPDRSPAGPRHLSLDSIVPVRPTFFAQGASSEVPPLS